MADQNLPQSKWGRGRARVKGVAKPTESLAIALPAPMPPAPMPPGAASSRLLQDMIAQTPGASGDSRQHQGASSTAGLTKQMSGLAVTNVCSSTSSCHATNRSKDTGPYLTRAKTLNSKLGTSGQPVALTSNHFRLNEHTHWCLYQYRVDFEPDEDRMFVRKLLMRAHKDFLNGYIFEGTVLYTSRRLFPESKNELELFSLRSNDNVKIRMDIRQVGVIVICGSHYVQVFNILMRMCLSTMHLQLVGHDFFEAIPKVEVLQWKLELWPGYKTSIRQHEQSIMMCTEVLQKGKSQNTVLDLYRICAQYHPTELKNIFLQSVVGSVVIMEKTFYLIEDVDFEMSPCDTFEKRPGHAITYVEHYLSKYGLRVHPDQPLLVSKSKPRERRAGCSDLVYIVPELCRCIGFNDAMRTTFSLTQDLHHHTRLSPEKRMESLLAFNAKLTKNPETRDLLTRWNLELAPDLCSFKGRILSQEDIIITDSKHKSGQDTDWTKSLRYSSMLRTYSLKNWCVVGSAAAMRDAKVFAEEVIKAGNCMKFQIGRPDFFEIKGQDRSTSYNETLEQVISERNPQLILCAVPNNDPRRYSAIKQKCCVDRPVPTQVVAAKTMRSKNIISVATKVAIQMNCKIGGAPWAVEIPLEGLMVVGFDVCHDTLKKGKLYGALVCSLDKALSRYFSHVTAHTSSEELSNNMSVGMTAALASYKSYNNGRLPKRIVMYRDGVGDGQIPYIIDCETKHLLQTLTAIYMGQPPKIAFIIVSKRIDTRVFLNKQDPPSGTVADDVITLPHRYDFFLVSQSVRQGTVSPTSYNVIYDSLGLSPDKMQRLTYKLTHLYFNWRGTICVPAPVQYAHKLASLVGQAIHTAPSQQLQDSLYFL